MDTDDFTRRLREQQVSWNDVRERRVLNRVLEGARRPLNRTAYWVAGGAGVVAAAACALLILLLGFDDIGAPTEASDDGETSILALGENGRAVLEPGSEVSIVQRTARALELDQTRGSVRYEIERVAGQRIVVLAAGVEISVVGTVFEVSIVESQLVRVAVERGIVKVDDGRRELEIGRGEEIAVSFAGEREPIVDGDDATEGPPGEAEEAPVESDSQLSDQESRKAVKRQDARKPAASPGAAADGASDLLARIDEARRSGRRADAARLLRRFIDEYPKDPRVVSSLFTLGKVDRSLARHESAALSFNRCWKRAPGGALAEDARAEEAVSWSNAGRADRAARAARDYLRRYPRGTHAARMQRLVE
jgi:TolA-binding protein